MDTLSTNISQLNVALDTVRVIIPSSAVKPLPLEYIYLAIAILAVFFGPWIQLLIGRRQMATQLKLADSQIRASVLSTNRQQWINTLRDTVAEFASVVVSIGAMSIMGTDPSKDERYLIKTERAAYLLYKVKLLTNPSKEPHKELVRLMGTVLDAMRVQDFKLASGQIEQVSTITQTILNNEWIRVKNLQ